MPFLRSLPEDMRILRQVRSPDAVIRSLLGIGMFDVDQPHRGPASSGDRHRVEGKIRRVSPVGGAPWSISTVRMKTTTPTPPASKASLGTLIGSLVKREKRSGTPAIIARRRYRLRRGPFSRMTVLTRKAYPVDVLTGDPDVHEIEGITCEEMP